jgi:CRP/FNR family transcriptional regulator
MGWLSIAHAAEGNGFAPYQSERLPSRIEPSFARRDAVPAQVVETAPPAVRTVAANEFLFKSGDARTHIFRVESGSICIYETRSNDRPSLIEFVFPGDYVGFGFLEEHSLSARALLETTVTCLPLDSIEDVVRDNPKAQAKFAQAIDREFETHRQNIARAGQRQPIERVAALLVTSANTNVQQGRDADLIKDSWKCGVIADLLQLSLDELAAVLVELERRELIEATSEGLRLTDIAALEALADGLDPAISQGGVRAPARSARPAERAADYRAA